MTRCNGFCSAGKGILARKILVGETAPSAGRARHCSAAWPGISARSTPTPLPSSSHCLTGTPTGTVKMTAQTWTFAVQTKSKPMPAQTA
jgi:hypothetical protein